MIYFLNVFDEGYFYDASKKKIDFTNSIIIMTSNLGYGEEVFNKSSLGFVEKNISKEEIMNVYETAKENGYKFFSFGDAMIII